MKKEKGIGKGGSEQKKGDGEARAARGGGKNDEGERKSRRGGETAYVRGCCCCVANVLFRAWLTWLSSYSPGSIALVYERPSRAGVWYR